MWCIDFVWGLCYNALMKSIVEIVDVSYEGSGVGRLDGKVVFVPKTLVGDVVRISKVKENRSYILGEVVAFERKSQDRIVAKCPYFEKCGGCVFQHCDGEKEHEIKKNFVLKEFKEIGFVSSANRFFYRNKIKLDYVDGQLGFYSGKNRQFIEIKKCLIADEKINFALEKLGEFLQKNHFSMLKSVYIKKVENDVGICFLFEKMQKNPLKNAKILKFCKNLVFFMQREMFWKTIQPKFSAFLESKNLRKIMWILLRNLIFLHSIKSTILLLKNCIKKCFVWCKEKE